jgi:hypothetical protein
MAEPLKATFFTLKHRDRAVLLPATLVMIVIVGLILGAWAALNWGALSQLFELLRTQPAELDQDQAARMFTGMMGMILTTFLTLIPLYIAIASYEAACLRWMIRGEAPGLFGLTIDNDTWRVWGVYWCWLVTNMAIGMVASMLMFPFMFMMIGEIAAQGGEPDPAAMFEMQLKMQAISLIQYIPMIFIGIRLGPAAATSIARKRFSFFEAWTVTADRFWPLFGAFALLWVLFAVAYAAVFAGFYWPLVGDLIPQLIEEWPNYPPETGRQLAGRVFNTEGMTLIIGAYAANIIVWVGYALMAYGVNARAALAALEEGKIEQAKD